jgi:hypothetical protein
VNDSDRTAGVAPAVAGVADRSAGVSPAVSGTSRPRFGAVTIRDRGRLPHWELEGGTYFVTFRLADSLPTSVVDEIEMEKRRLLNSSRPLTQGEKRKIDRIAFVKLEKYLDAGRGECLLREPRVAQIVQVALEHFNDRRYRLFAWCVMPNHVHAALKLFPSFSLQDVLQSWKSFTAKKAIASSTEPARSGNVNTLIVSYVMRLNCVACADTFCKIQSRRV